MYARLEDLRCPRLTPTGSQLRQVFGKWDFSIRLSGSSLTILTTIPFLRYTFSSIVRLILSLVASAAQYGPSLNFDATSRYLYKICHSRFDGRHNLAHAGTYPKSVRVSWNYKNLHCIGLSIWMSSRASLNGSLSFPSSFTIK